MFCVSMSPVRLWLLSRQNTNCLNALLSRKLQDLFRLPRRRQCYSSKHDTSTLHARDMIAVASFAAEASWLSKCWRSLAQGQGDISTQLGIINGRKTLLTTIWLNFTWSFSAKCNQCIHIWLKFDLPSENQHWNASPKWDCLKVGIPPNGHDHGKMIVKLSINIFSGTLFPDMFKEKHMI